jgi:A/G-specific adenine glycosylase
MFWWQENRRELPWKATSDPYPVWISEIILQQTRVAQGLKYYEHFLSRFPTIFALAAASEEEVLKAWEGLGYYNRARNIHFTARQIVDQRGGLFPESYEEILSLRGIGEYTAAAIISFCFGKPYPVVDGNVLRLTSRILGISEDIQQREVQQKIKDFLSKAIQNASPADFNQALMDFGALQCQPVRPLCMSCLMKEYCRAFQESKTTEIPFKKKKKPLHRRYMHFFDIDIPGGFTLVQQRNTEEIWPGLFQLPVLETKSAVNPPDYQIAAMVQEITGMEQILPSCSLVASSVQVLSHQKIYGYFYKLTLNTLNIIKKKDLYLVEREKVSKFAFSKIVSDYLHSADFTTLKNGMSEKGM